MTKMFHCKLSLDNYKKLHLRKRTEGRTIGYLVNTALQEYFTMPRVAVPYGTERFSEISGFLLEQEIYDRLSVAARNEGRTKAVIINHALRSKL